MNVTLAETIVNQLSLAQNSSFENASGALSKKRIGKKRPPGGSIFTPHRCSDMRGNTRNGRVFVAAARH
jgi:hypothetical protein